jgi:hypothetical protein
MPTQPQTPTPTPAQPQQPAPQRFNDWAML